MSLTTRRDRPWSGHSRRTAICIGVFLALATVFTGVAPAHALHPVEQAGPRAHWTHRHHAPSLAKPCRQKAHKHHRSARHCHGFQNNHVSARHPLHRGKMLSRYGDLTAPDGTTLRSAFNRPQGADKAGSRKIYWRTFWQDGLTVPGPRNLYQERHDGMGFFDGKHVWFNGPGNRPGDHSCYTVHEIGYDVTTDECDEKLRYTDSNTPYIQYWCRFKVGFLYSGLPFSTHFDMHANIHAGGGITFWRGDERQ